MDFSFFKNLFSANSKAEDEKPEAKAAQVEKPEQKAPEVSEKNVKPKKKGFFKRLFGGRK